MTTLGPRAFVAASILVAVGGCVGADDGESAHAGYELGTAREELSKSCQVGKYSGTQGADVSSWQGNFNWNGAGVKWGYARISDGTGYIDKEFADNWASMKKAGILRGAYQYFEPGQSATAQAKMMVDKVGILGEGTLPSVIDVEATGGQSPSTIADKVKTWLEIVEKGTGKRPIIYTGAYFWDDNVKSTAFGKYPLWIAAYGTSCPSVPAGWKKWTFWQYCDGQPQYCSNAKGFDRDVFDGSKADLEKLANESSVRTLKAKLVRKWSNARRHRGKQADYVVCAKDDFKMSFTFRNTGSADWRDVKYRGKNPGDDVFLATANGKADKLTGKKRFSVKLNKNSHVRANRKGLECTKTGCRKTTFIEGGIHVTAPKDPGIYHSRWRLRDYSKAWKHAKGFGPKVEMKVQVVDCTLDKPCGCQVSCTNGKSVRLTGYDIDSDAMCKSVASAYCQTEFNAGYLSHDYQACPTPGGTGGSGGTGTGGTGTSAGAGGTSGGDGFGSGSIGGSGGEAGASDTGGTAGAAGADPGTGSGDPAADGSDPSGADPEPDPNADEDDSANEWTGADVDDENLLEEDDDPDYADDGFDGSEEGPAPQDQSESGCSVARAGSPSAWPMIGIAGLAIVIGARRRSKRNPGR